MTYSLFILPRAQKELAKLPSKPYKRVKEAIYGLGESPKPKDSKKLAGREGWRIRVGGYRVIYEVNEKDKSVIVLHVGHRRDVYR